MSIVFSPDTLSGLHGGAGGWLEAATIQGSCHIVSILQNYRINNSRHSFLSSFNMLCLPDYSSKAEFKRLLLIALNEGSEGFGLVQSWLHPGHQKVMVKIHLYRRICNRCEYFVCLYTHGLYCIFPRLGASRLVFSQFGNEPKLQRSRFGRIQFRHGERELGLALISLIRRTLRD